MGFNLALLLRRRRAGTALDVYGVLGLRPDLVFDFANEVYRTNGSTDTFSGAITYTGASNKTMVDSDGLLKWAPHNLALNSATPATQSITVVSGADYTVECTGVSIALSGAGTGTVTEGNPIEITASTTTLTLTVTGSTGTMWVYRSDLGGMVGNPDTGNSYVPTTSAARYLPRRGHHVWNGSAWVNEGLLVEIEARTNLVAQSNNFSTSWVAVAISPTANEIGIDGVSNSATTVTASGTVSYCYIGAATTAGTATGSFFVKSGTANVIWLYWNSTASDGVAYFDLSDESVQAVAGSGQTPTNLQIQKFGDFYRVSASWVVTTGTTNFGFGSANAKGSLTTTSGNSLIVYGAQLEAGSTPSSYIPTSGSTVTRAAETLTIPAAKLPYSATAMSIQMDGLETFADEGSATQEILFDWRVDSNNRITLALDTDSTKVGTLTLTMVNGSGTDETISTTAELTPGVNDPFNVAIVCTSNEIGIALDGTAETRVSHSIGLPDLSGADATLGGNGTRALVRAWNQDITDAGIEAASA